VVFENCINQRVSKEIVEALFFRKNNFFLAILRKRDSAGECGECKYKFCCDGCRTSSFLKTRELFNLDSFYCLNKKRYKELI